VGGHAVAPEGRTRGLRLFSFTIGAKRGEHTRFAPLSLNPKSRLSPIRPAWHGYSWATVAGGQAVLHRTEISGRRWSALVSGARVDRPDIGDVNERHMLTLEAG